MKKNKALEQLLANSRMDTSKEPDFKGEFWPGMKKNEIFGSWKVSLKGDMSFKNGRYFIDSKSLSENDWFLHLSDKAWINWNEFMPAYFQALTNAGHKELRQLVSD